MDVRSGGASYSATFRSNRDPADTTSRVTTTAGGSMNDLSGFIDSGGLVTRFHAIAVPEPAIWSLWLAGAGLFIALKRKARR